MEGSIIAGFFTDSEKKLAAGKRAHARRLPDAGNHTLLCAAASTATAGTHGI
jgi:hypothetical protein